jgi:PAS domain S-box-containing protein
MTEGRESGRNARLLIIDHDRQWLSATSRLLVEAGYQTFEAANGSEGLRLARQTKPDLVLLNIDLPDMDGLQVCHRINTDPELVGTCVTILTGRDVGADDEVEVLAQEVPSQPVSDQQLLSRTEAMLRLQSAEDMWRAQMHELRERSKELNCLYGISKLIESEDLSLPEILQGTAELIPPAWQFPDIACARIVLDDKVYQTEGFRETIWTQSRAIQVHRKPAGRIEIYYLEERPEEDEGPFLEEERSLLNAIAERLGRVVERTRAEQALSVSEERYRAVSELTSDLAYAFRVEEDGSLVSEWVTQALSQVTGFTSEELAAREGWASLIHPDDWSAAQRHTQKLLSGEDDAHELRIITRDGQVRWLHDSGHPQWDKAQSRVARIYGAAREITERKQAEEALRYQAALMKSVSDAVITTDLEFSIQTWNSAAEALYGWSAEEAIGKLVGQVVPTEYPHGQAEAVLAEFQAEGIWQGEVIQRHKDGGDLYVLASVTLVRDEAGHPVSILAVNRDITERRQMEVALQRERDLLARVMDTSPMGIAVFDRKGRLTFANTLLQQLASPTGATTLIGRTYNDPVWQGITLDDEPLPDEALPFAQVMTTGGPVRNVEHGVRLPDGARLYLSSNASPLIGESGQIESVVVTTEDITHRKQAETQLEEAAASAERERLARELHDAVTQSLFSVAAIAEAFPRVWERDPQEARRGLEELRWLTQGALAEMRAMLLELRPAALTEQRLGVLLRQLTDAMRNRTRMPVTTTLVGDSTLPADVQIALYRIAQEALNNITKHARATQTRLSLHCEPTLVRLRISDDGLGFDPDSTQPQQMGMRIMHERAADVGAKLIIESQPGRGTRIEVEWCGS